MQFFANQAREFQPFKTVTLSASIQVLIVAKYQYWQHICAMVLNLTIPVVNIWLLIATFLAA